MIESIFHGCGEVFTKQTFICGFKYTCLEKHKCQLLNFVLGQAKMAVYVSRKRKVDKGVDTDVVFVFGEIQTVGRVQVLYFNYINEN